MECPFPYMQEKGNVTCDVLIKWEYFLQKRFCVLHFRGYWSFTTLKRRSGSSRSASSSGSSLNILPATFDRHLVLIGCQTFQDFFDLHPQVLKNFDQYDFIKINGGLTCADALKMHASRVLALVEDIVNNSGNPEKIRSLLQELGKHHCQQVRTCVMLCMNQGWYELSSTSSGDFLELELNKVHLRKANLNLSPLPPSLPPKGISEEHLDMLGPIVCHTIRPVVFKSGLWSIEVEKSWNHLFDMVAVLMRRGYPSAEAGGGANGCSSAATGSTAAGGGGGRKQVVAECIL